MSEIERLKEILGIGFAGSVLTAVESQKEVINDLKTALDLLPDASLVELQERISVLKDEHDALQDRQINREIHGCVEHIILLGEKSSWMVYLCGHVNRDYLDSLICFASTDSTI